MTIQVNKDGSVEEVETLTVSRNELDALKVVIGKALTSKDALGTVAYMEEKNLGKSFESILDKMSRVVHEKGWCEDVNCTANKK